MCHLLLELLYVEGIDVNCPMTAAIYFGALELEIIYRLYGLIFQPKCDEL